MSRTTTSGCVFAAVAGVAVLLASCSSGSSAKHAAAGTNRATAQVSVSACGKGWTGGHAGQTHLVLRNTDTRSGEVDLLDARTKAVYAEVEPLGPNTSSTLDAKLGAGSYVLRCAMDDEPAVMGSVIRLTGDAKGSTPAVQPVSQADLIAATKAYQGYVEQRLPQLNARVTALRTDIAGGRLAQARRDWLPAHLAYISLGAAYSSFGDQDAEIDGLPDGLSGGVHDPSWQGLHRIEYGLWHGQSAAALRKPADDVVTAVRTLAQQFPHAQIDPLDISIRAHEITEDAVGFALTGRDDFGSHTSLATVDTDISGTRTVLGFLKSLLTTRLPGYASLDRSLATASADLTALRTSSGSWPALSELSRAQRERINADISELAEQLAPVASILEPRRTS